MACVGLDDRKTTLERCVADSDTCRGIQRFARISTVAKHVQPAVPLRGKAQLESHLRQDLTEHAAKLRNRCGGGYRTCRQNRELVGRHPHDGVALDARLCPQRARQTRVLPIFERLGRVLCVGDSCESDNRKDDSHKGLMRETSRIFMSGFLRLRADDIPIGGVGRVAAFRVRTATLRRRVFATVARRVHVIAQYMRRIRPNHPEVRLIRSGRSPPGVTFVLAKRCTNTSHGHIESVDAAHRVAALLNAPFDSTISTGLRRWKEQEAQWQSARELRVQNSGVSAARWPRTCCCWSSFPHFAPTRCGWKAPRAGAAPPRSTSPLWQSSRSRPLSTWCTERTRRTSRMRRSTARSR